MNTDDEQTTPPEGEERDEETTPPGGDGTTDEDDEDQQDGDTFPRAYVQRLRDRSAGYRTRARELEARTTSLERDLFTERVRALDVLADPADLPFSAELLDDPDALAGAVEELARSKPHYRKRGTTTPDATGARDRNRDTGTVSLTGIMRGHS